MGYAFISYSSKNKTQADSIHDLFKRNRIDTWMAPYDIPTGSKYAAVITSTIRECSCFVLLLSNDSQTSEAVDSEVELAAYTFKKPIIPIALENVILNDSFHYYLHNKHITPIYKIDEDSKEIKSVLNSVIAFAGQKGTKKIKSKKKAKNAKIGIIALPGSEDIANKVDGCLKIVNTNLSTNNSDSCIIPVTFFRSRLGDGNCIIKKDVANHDLFIICDLYNCSSVYQMRGCLMPMSPDAHYANLKSVVKAVNGSANRITIIMPMLYDGLISNKLSERKDMLNELFESLEIDSVITFDANIDFEYNNEIKNFKPYQELANALNGLVKGTIFNKENSFIISNEQGTGERGQAYSKLFNLDMGRVYKIYDDSRTINGKHPVVAMELSKDVSKYQNVFLVTDMVLGESLVESCRKIKESGVKNIYILATYGVFSSGIDYWDKAYKNNFFDKIICTNLTHTDDELKNREWYEEIDMANCISEIIYSLHNDEE